MRNRSNGTGGRVSRVIDCPGGRVLEGLESGTGHWGSLAVVVAAAGVPGGCGCVLLCLLVR